MKYSFTCYGHENITSKHKTTLEFTKDNEIELEGDCIVGVKADFNAAQLKKFIISLGNNRKITIIIETINNTNNEKDFNKNKINKTIENNNYKSKNNGKTINENNIKNNNKIIEKINAEINPNFNSDDEMVIRKSDFISERTFAIKADKAAFELDNGLVGFLKGEENKIRVIVKNS